VRRTLLALTLVVAALFAGLAFSTPASSRQGEGATLTITKVVDGDGPTGGYVIDYDCVANGGKGSGFNGTGSLNFDTAGPGAPESQDVFIDGPTICTVTETDSNGATTTTYACAFEAGPTPGSPDSNFAAPEGDLDQGCIDDQSGAIAFPYDHLTITVTNTFEPEVLPDDDEPPAVNPDVVTATPSFTG
jgi:hypothetical protein